VLQQCVAVVRCGSVLQQCVAEVCCSIVLQQCVAAEVSSSFRLWSGKRQHTQISLQQCVAAECCRGILQQYVATVCCSTDYIEWQAVERKQTAYAGIAVLMCCVAVVCCSRPIHTPKSSIYTQKKMPVSHKSIRVTPQHCRALIMGCTSLLMPYRAHIRCNAMHLSFYEAHIHSTHIMCPQTKLFSYHKIVLISRDVQPIDM